MRRAAVPSLLALLLTTAALTPAGAEPAPRPELNSDGSPRQLPPGAPELPGRMLVLRYFDFGPQAMAFGLLGMEWWQWAACACFEPDDQFDVRVVVYRGVKRSAVARRYPVVKDRGDYRYVEYRAALRYLDQQLADLGQPSELPELRAELAATRRRIIAGLARPR